MYTGKSNKQGQHSQEKSLRCHTRLPTAVVSIPLLLSSFSCPVTQRALLLG